MVTNGLSQVAGDDADTTRKDAGQRSGEVSSPCRRLIADWIAHIIMAMMTQCAV